MERKHGGNGVGGFVRIQNTGQKVYYIPCDEFHVDIKKRIRRSGFGRPAMGDEVLEESEFEPCLTPAWFSLLERKSRCSVLMDGEMENG